MSGTWTTFRERADRCPSVPCHLAPPLRELWSVAVPKLPVIEHGVVVVRDRMSGVRRREDDTSIVAMDEQSGKRLWSVGYSLLATIFDDHVVCSGNYRKREDNLRLRELRTGKLVATIDAPCGLDHAMVGSTLMERSFENDRHLVRAVSLAKARVLWEYVAPAGVRIDAPFAANEDRVIVAQDDGAVIAFSLVTGEEMWRHSLADLSLQLPSGTRPGSADGLLAIWDDKVVMTVSATHVLALSLRDGSRCWDWKSESAALFRTGYLYDGRYYTLDSLGGYAVVDAATGKLVLAVRLQVPAKTGVASVSLPILASETHFFTGSRQGPIVAFERDTGKFVWAGMPRKGGGTEAFSLEFATANGRLYYADMGFRLWCMEEVTPSDPGRQVKRKSGRK